MSLSFICVTMVFRFAQRRPSTSDRCRWSSNDLCFSLWKKSDTRSRPLRREERLHGLFFFWFENSFCHSKWSKKKRKQANASLRPIVGWKKAEKKKSSSALDTRSKIDQTQGRASRAIDRAPAPERPRLRYDLRNRRPGSPWLHLWSNCVLDAYWLFGESGPWAGHVLCISEGSSKIPARSSVASFFSFVTANASAKISSSRLLVSSRAR